jgi:hypothetical protein
VVTLYHGTSKAAAEKILRDGFVRGKVYLTPSKESAWTYAGPDGRVLAVDVPAGDLEPDLDTENYDGETMNEWLELGRSVWTKARPRVVRQVNPGPARIAPPAKRDPKKNPGRLRSLSKLTRV